ncbi:MAG: hypothetical protein K5989_00915 [Lachnospiraceae bacterium]|nr:hypothetical protein [Lachnospiraceae bacterium]
MKRKIARRALALLISGVMTGALLSGCGSGGAAGQASTEAASSEPAPAAASEAQPETETQETEASEEVTETEMMEETETGTEAEDTETEAAGETAVTELPPYEYTGDEPYVKEISDFYIDMARKNYAPTQVTIPVVNILEVDDTKPDDILVWCRGFIHNYDLRNTTLMDRSGGACDGLFHMKPSGGGYEITETDFVGDGSDNGPDTKRIFGMKDGLLKKYESSEEDMKMIRLQEISNYVNTNGIYITQYQDYGWDPVPLINAPMTTEEEESIEYHSILGYTMTYNLTKFSLMEAASETESDIFGGIGFLQNYVVSVEKRSGQTKEELAEEVKSSFESGKAEADMALFGNDGTGEPIESTLVSESTQDKPGEMKSIYYIIPRGEDYLILGVTGRIPPEDIGDESYEGDAALEEILASFVLE